MDGRKKRVVPREIYTERFEKGNAERTEVSKDYSSWEVKDRISRSFEYDWEM